jgi:hypothetical protein
MGKERKMSTFSVERSEENSQLGRPRQECRDNLNTDIKETGWKGTDWINLVSIKYREFIH